MTAGAALLVAACTGAPGTGGRYLAVDDTGLPPHAIEKGWMMAVPAATAEDLLGRPQNDAWNFHVVDVDADQVDDAGGEWRTVGRGGRFDLPVDPGAWTVCAVGDAGGSTRPRTVGCAQITLADGDRLLATIGENGFWVEHEE